MVQFRHFVVCINILMQTKLVHCLTNKDANHLKPNSSNYYTLPYRPNLPFSISDIRALWRSGMSVRVPECQKLKMVDQAFMALYT